MGRNRRWKDKGREKGERQMASGRPRSHERRSRLQAHWLTIASGLPHDCVWTHSRLRLDRLIMRRDYLPIAPEALTIACAWAHDCVWIASLMRLDYLTIGSRLRLD